MTFLLSESTIAYLVITLTPHAILKIMSAVV